MANCFSRRCLQKEKRNESFDSNLLSNTTTTTTRTMVVLVMMMMMMMMMMIIHTYLDRS